MVSRRSGCRSGRMGAKKGTKQWNETGVERADSGTKRGLGGDVQKYLRYVKRERGHDVARTMGRRCRCVYMGRWGRVDLVLFFWRYNNLIYRIGVGNTCGDRIGSVLARLNSNNPLRLCFAYRLYSKRCVKRNRFSCEEDRIEAAMAK